MLVGGEDGSAQVFTLVDLAAGVWDHLDRPCTVDELVEALSGQRTTGPAPADVDAAAVDEVVSRLVDAGLLVPR